MPEGREKSFPRVNETKLSADETDLTCGPRIARQDLNCGLADRKPVGTNLVRRCLQNAQARIVDCHNSRNE